MVRGVGNPKRRRGGIAGSDGHELATSLGPEVVLEGVVDLRPILGEVAVAKVVECDVVLDEDSVRGMDDDAPL